MRTLTSALTSAVVAGTVLAASAPAWADFTVLFWPGGSEADAMEAAVQEYNRTRGAETGNEGEVIFYSRQGFFDKLLADLAAGSTEFDLNLVTTYSLGRYAPFLSPIDEYLSDQTGAVFPESALSTLQFDGKQYGIPTDISLHFLYFRQDLIDQLLSDADWQARYAEIAQEHLGQALQPKPPADWTWDDYIATSLFFTQSINPDSPTRYGTVLQMKNLIFNIMLWQATVVSNGGDWMDESGNLTLDSDAVRRGLDIYKTLVDAGATPESSINYEYGETNAAFGSGQAATMMQWSAAVQEMDDAETNPTVAGKVGLAPLPAGSAGHRTHIHSLGLGMNAAAPNKEDAGDFLRWFSTPEAMALYAKEGGTPPAPDILAAVPDRREFPLIGQYVADYGFVVRGGTAAYAVPVYEALAQAYTGYWSGQTDLDTAIADAAAQAAERMKQ